MAGKNDGGPAFPQPSVWMPNLEQLHYGEAGMSIRDYFAGQWLVSNTFEFAANPIKVAERCYDMADAMLKVRQYDP